VSLFGGPAATAPELRIELPETDDWPLLQKLQGERDTLGHYLSGHPIDPYRDELRALLGHDLGDLDRLFSERPEDQRRGWRQEATVVVAGQVVGTRKRGDSLWPGPVWGSGAMQRFAAPAREQRLSVLRDALATLS
jgi:DNA polymerase-3 subunit alpha